MIIMYELLLNYFFYVTFLLVIYVKIHNLVFAYEIIFVFSPACHCFDLHFEPFDHVLWISQLCLIYL